MISVVLLELMNLSSLCLNVTRGGVFDNICGQKEAQPGVFALRGRGQPGQQQELKYYRDRDPGNSPPAGCFLLHRQREYPAEATPPPNRIHCHTGMLKEGNCKYSSNLLGNETPDIHCLKVAVLFSCLAVC